MATKSECLMDEFMNVAFIGRGREEPSSFCETDIGGNLRAFLMFASVILENTIMM